MPGPGIGAAGGGTGSRPGAGFKASIARGPWGEERLPVCTVVLDHCPYSLVSYTVENISGFRWQAPTPPGPGSAPSPIVPAPPGTRQPVEEPTFRPGKRPGIRRPAAKAKRRKLLCADRAPGDGIVVPGFGKDEHALPRQQVRAVSPQGEPPERGEPRLPARGKTLAETSLRRFHPPGGHDDREPDQETRRHGGATIDRTADPSVPLPSHLGTTRRFRTAARVEPCALP